MITRAELPTYRIPTVIGGIVAAGASLMAYLIGFYTRQAGAPDCRRIYCPSERDLWSMGTRDWFLGVFLLGILVAWSALVWRPITTHTRLRRLASFIALIVCVPVAGVLWVVTVLIAGNTCGPDSFLCFSGNDALVVAVPAALATIVSVLLAASLSSPDDERPAQVSGALGLTIFSGVLVLVAAGFVLGALGV